jgi:hypothetical protein
MIDATALLATLTRRGVRLTARPPKLIAEPGDLLSEEDCQAIRACKPELMNLLSSAPAADPTDDALALLGRLRGFTLPDGRMAAARALAERLRPLLAGPELDPAQALAHLQAVESELIAAGGRYDPELAAAIDRALDPGAQLVEVRKLPC